MVKKFFMVLLVHESEEEFLELLAVCFGRVGRGYFRLVVFQFDLLDVGDVSTSDTLEGTVVVQDCPFMEAHLEPPRRLSGKKKSSQIVELRESFLAGSSLL